MTEYVKLHIYVQSVFSKLTWLSLSSPDIHQNFILILAFLIVYSILLLQTLIKSFYNHVLVRSLVIFFAVTALFLVCFLFLSFWRYSYSHQKNRFSFEKRNLIRIPEGKVSVKYFIFHNWCGKMLKTIGDALPIHVVLEDIRKPTWAIQKEESKTVLFYGRHSVSAFWLLPRLPFQSHFWLWSFSWETLCW